MRILNMSTLDSGHTVAPYNHPLMHCCRCPESTGVSWNSATDLLRRFYSISGDSALFQPHGAMRHTQRCARYRNSIKFRGILYIMQSNYRYWHYYNLSNSYKLQCCTNAFRLSGVGKDKPIWQFFVVI